MPFSGMFEEEARVLRRSEEGGWKRAASDLYPHQWRWDPAFIAIGLADSTRPALPASSPRSSSTSGPRVRSGISSSTPMRPRQLLPQRGPPGNGAEPARRPGRVGRDQRPAPTPVHSIAAGRIREVYEVENGRRSVGGPLNGFLKVVYPSSCAGTITCLPTSTLRGPGR